ncbi:GxxExxY protein [Saccharicrinis aurantiacus]|uniref:GxxExxY protein n=1 Tax=Saccharicrinis aurantiacus TaxID=1849719 RepID=UPI000837BE01|nr:GxxExxY protein [Saccharicrinis aurantiacus]
MTPIIYKDESYNIIGACMAVHSQLGPGFLEAVYQEALEREFFKRKIPFESQKKLNINYNGERLKKYYVADFVCYNAIVVEIKALNYLGKNQFEQTGNYLRAINHKLGILVNFGSNSLISKRVLTQTFPSKEFV